MPFFSIFTQNLNINFGLQTLINKAFFLFFTPSVFAYF